MKTSDKDLQYWEIWNKSKRQEDLSSLLKQVNPLINKAVYKQSGSLAPAILESEAKIQALNAFKTFNPQKQVKLSTHVTNYLKKLTRLNYEHQEVFKVPEARRIKYHTYATVKSHMEEDVGRAPTLEELAEKLGWSYAEVGRFQRENKKELSDAQPISNDANFFRKDTAARTLAYIYNDLPPKDKLVLEYTTGYGGKDVLSNKEIMKKLNMTQGQLSYAKTKLTDKLVEVGN